MKNNVVRDGKIHICQMLHTLQGEGQFLGSPVILIRVCGCNLDCKFCDTKELMYTSDYKSYTPQELADYVNKIISKTNCKHLLITGGEPLLYKAEILEFLKDINNAKIIEIETNGELLSGIFIQSLIDVHKYKNPQIVFNISPKSNNFEKYVFGYRGSIVSYTYKLVIDTFNIKKEKDRILKAIKYFKNNKIYLMPMTEKNETIESLKYKLKVLEPICRDYNIALTPRLHMIIYDSVCESNNIF
jgi:7-carboxy-7-deazaguanine synthase